MEYDRRIENDLAKNFENKIKRAMSDYLILCRAVDIPMRESVPGAMASLLYVFAHVASMSSKMTAEEFGDVCKEAFESHKKWEKTNDRGE
jgi:hypothetical protein